MANQSAENYLISFTDEAIIRREAERRRQYFEENRPAGRNSYLFKMGRIPVKLGLIEFRILSFLSARPYRAYTPRQIVEAVSTPTDPIREEMLDVHIASLRDKLGLFRDYVQSVPFIGYRFKA
jgi:DNA-binding response OmpR family regulator